MKRGHKRREWETDGKTATENENGGSRQLAKQRRSEARIPAAAKSAATSARQTKTDSLRSERSETSDYRRELRETSKGPSAQERPLGSVSALPT